MWTVSTPAVTVAVAHEQDARHYVSRHYPSADRTGVYSFRSRGVDITIKHN